ncbi:hypothetical protein AUC31_01890 [Planococcus rifietoensis]|uniref:Permease n=1 Tax=Planococcus rifietoensis TaxID=200991 RepID=A0A0U2XB85_9BACL|nr:hypothetical protein [Planococcus rifietoensis]ALS74079.1 hypothetical protein AUC31_01890 [Planococcus rifietoensis]
MSIIFWTDIRRFISWPLFLAIGGIFLLTFSERQLTEDSYELFLLRMVSEQYYLLFFMLPLYLLSIYVNLEPGLPNVVIRFKTFSSYFFTRSFAILFNTGLFVSVHVLVICLLGLGLSSQNLFMVSDTTSNILLNEYAKHFDTPLSAIFVSVLFMLAGLSFLSFLMQTFHHFFGKRVLIKEME